MKATIKQIVECYKRLDTAKVNKLEEADAVKLLKARKAMRPYVDEYDAFLKDCQEKFKPEDWEEVQGKIQKWQQEGENTTLTIEERKEVNKAVIDYQKKIDAAVGEELKREVELTIDKLGENCDVKLLQENGWKYGELDEIEIVL